MSLTKRVLEDREINTNTLKTKLHQLEKRIQIIEEYVNNMIKEKGTR